MFLSLGTQENGCNSRSGAMRQRIKVERGALALIYSDSGRVMKRYRTSYQ